MQTIISVWRVAIERSQSASKKKINRKNDRISRKRDKKREKKNNDDIGSVGLVNEGLEKRLRGRFKRGKDHSPWRNAGSPCQGGTPWICVAVGWWWRRRLCRGGSCAKRRQATGVRGGRARAWAAGRSRCDSDWAGSWSFCRWRRRSGSWSTARRPRRGRSRAGRPGAPGRPASCGLSPSRWPPDFQGPWPRVGATNTPPPSPPTRPSTLSSPAPRSGAVEAAGAACWTLAPSRSRCGKQIISLRSTFTVPFSFFISYLVSSISISNRVFWTFWEENFFGNLKWNVMIGKELRNG